MVQIALITAVHPPSHRLIRLKSSKLKTTLIIGVLKSLSLLPLSWARAVGRLFGHLFWWIQVKPARVAQINLQHCFPDLAAEDRQKLAKQSFVQTSVTSAEMAAAWCWPADRVYRLISSIEGEELLAKAKQDGTGILFLSPHLGNWEVICAYLGKNYDISILYQPPKVAEFESFIVAARERFGIQLVPTDKRGVIRLFQILREKGVVGILPDQEPETSGGIFAPFFGLPANTIKLVSKLVEKTGARVLCLSALRLPGNRGFKLVIQEADPDIYSADLLTSVTALNRTVETAVKLAPEQYQWVYKRFKRTPDGRRHFYD